MRARGRTDGRWWSAPRKILADVASGLRDGGFEFEVVEIIDDYVVPHSRYLFPVHRNGRSASGLEPKQERVLHLEGIRADSGPAVRPRDNPATIP